MVSETVQLKTFRWTQKTSWRIFWNGFRM